MGIALRVLIVEDSPDDAELILLQLRKAGYEPVWVVVETPEAMSAALENESWDLVISDYSLPRFDAPAALAVLVGSGRDLPFIVVSGSIGEDTAVRMMKIGAHDYVLKQNATRLGPAVLRELREAENRRQRRLAEGAARRLEAERNALLEQLKQENEDLVSLTRLTSNAINTLDLAELLRGLLGQVVEVMRADTATILLAEGDELRVRASAGAVNFSDSTLVTHVGEGFAGAVASRMKAIYVEDAALDSLVMDPLIRERGIRSMLGVPLTRNGALIGVLHADWLTVRPRRDREVHLLEITAERCAAAIQNARLYEAAQYQSEELRASEERFRQLAEAVDEVFWVTDPARGKLIYISPGYEKVWGRPGASLDAAPAHRPDAIHPDDRERVHETIASAQAAGGYDTEYRIIRPDGAIRLIHDRAFPVRGEGGAVYRIVGVASDITARKQVEEELRFSVIEKEALLKEVHHRVKNNLQLVTSLLRLESGRSEEAGTRTVLKDMQGRIQAMALLHEALYRSGTFASVDLGAYLKQLAGQSFRALNTRADGIHLDLDLKSVHVGIDQAVPCGLLLNELVSNSLKHAFADGRAGTIRVELQGTGEGPQLRLRVSDTGVGLPADFETKRGHSLGLQLVSDLARQLGGRLEVEPGPGAALSVFFAADEGPTAHSTPPSR